MEADTEKDFTGQLQEDLLEGRLREHREFIQKSHPADLAETLRELDFEAARVLFYQLSEEQAAGVLMELDDELRGKFVEKYSGPEIARELVENLDSDDAADLINELTDARKREVLAYIQNPSQAKSIAELLVYSEGTAGALMATELIKVNWNWKVNECVREMRKQAEHVDKVHSIYVVDENNRLMGTLSLKKLLTTPANTPVSEMYDHSVKSVDATADGEDVANAMQKYDMVVMPVVDTIGHLLGRITIDDVVDFIREEAREDYNLASGLTEEVETDDSLLTITHARLPWLLIGLGGGLLAALVIGRYEGDLAVLPQMAFFIPLIAAMGGNVGVQSSAIIVQGLASKAVMGSVMKRLTKELTVALLNGLILGAIIIAAALLLSYPTDLALTVAFALIAVIIVAALIGTFVPLILNNYNIDPALATGPFITTLNDIIGLFIYFSIGRMFLGI